MSLAKRIGFRLTGLLLGLLLAFGVAELGLRLLLPQPTGPAQLVYDPRVGSIPRPNQRGRVNVPGVYSYTFAHDSSGMRMTGVVNRETARARVLLLGDSWTYGLGVSDHETFARKLEERLSQDGVSAAVINAGNMGKGTDYALRFFETIGKTLRPDMTVLSFFHNDFSDNIRGRIYKIAEDGMLSVRPRLGAASSRIESFTQTTLYSWIISWSHLANALRKVAILMMKRGERQGQEGHGLVEDYPEGPEGLVNERSVRVTRIYLDHLAKTVRAAGSDFVIFYLPGGNAVRHYRETRTALEPENALHEISSSIGEVVISLTPMVAASDASLEALYYDEGRPDEPTGHWTPLGHSIAAEHMERILKPKLTITR